MKFLKHALVALFAASLAPAAVHAEGIDDQFRAPYHDAFKGKKVAYIPLSMGIDVAQGWGALWQKQADQLGYEFIVRDPNWNTSAGAQAFTQLIAEHPDVIIIQNPDLQSYSRLARQAENAGIYVLQIQQSSATQTEAFVGPDWVELGSLLVESIHKRCGEGTGTSGKVAILQGQLTAAASLYQIKGVNDALAKHPDLKVVSNQAADWDASKANAVTKTVLQQNPDLCGIVGFWDGQDIGAAAAVEEAGMKGKVFIATSGSGESAMCKNVSDGKFSDVVNMDIPGGGRDINTMIRFLLQSKPAPGTLKSQLYVPLKVVAKETVQPSDCYKLEDLKK
jgi:ABC-type sugar transport system substrate-binding protein